MSQLGLQLVLPLQDGVPQGRVAAELLVGGLDPVQVQPDGVAPGCCGFGELAAGVRPGSFLPASGARTRVLSCKLECASRTSDGMPAERRILAEPTRERNK